MDPDSGYERPDPALSRRFQAMFRPTDLGCRNYQREFEQQENRLTCDEFLTLISNDITQKERELDYLKSQRAWFEEKKRDLPAGSHATNISSDGRPGLISGDFYPSEKSNGASNVPQDIVYSQQVSYTGNIDPYNGASMGKYRGPQCIAIKDFEAKGQDEIDLNLFDWGEIHKAEGSRYYGSVFSRGGKRTGWFHRSYVDVVPNSQIGRLISRYVVEATVKYDAHIKGFFSFGVGKKFDVLEENVSLDNDRNHTYHRVRDVTGMVGLVLSFCVKRCETQDPVLYQRDWYYPGISRAKAEDLLEKSQMHTFLFRDSGNAPGNFTVSVRGETKVFHVIVITHITGYRVRWDDFKTLDDILAHYRANPITRNLRLLNYLQKEEPHRYENMTHDVSP